MTEKNPQTGTTLGEELGPPATVSSKKQSVRITKHRGDTSWGQER